MKMRLALVASLATIWLAACSGNTPGFGGGGHDGGLTGDPNDPIICIGDPDTQIVCGKASDFWDCQDFPNAERKCNHTQPAVPDGKSQWTCVEKGGKLICTTTEKDAGPKGGGDWNCTSDDAGTTCEKDAPVPPGGGSWDCSYGSEFAWVCSGKTPPVTSDAGTPPPPPKDGGTTNPPPPGGGQITCYGPADSTGLPTPPEGAWAIVVAKKVLYQGQEAAYIRLTFSKAFVDNVYGQWAFGYHRKNPTQLGGHSFQDLLESDKAEIFFNDAKGDLTKHMVVDYISASSTVASGYKCLGVTGGEGSMLMGAPSDVLAAQSSLAVNFNYHGYVLTTDSPKTDKTYAADPAYPKWIWEVWYEVWVKWSSFTKGIGQVYITGIHASPSKIGQNRLDVVPVPCP